MQSWRAEALAEAFANHNAIFRGSQVQQHRYRSTYSSRLAAVGIEVCALPDEQIWERLLFGLMPRSVCVSNRNGLFEALECRCVAKILHSKQLQQLEGNQPTGWRHSSPLAVEAERFVSFRATVATEKPLLDANNIRRSGQMRSRCPARHFYISMLIFPSKACLDSQVYCTQPWLAVGLVAPGQWLCSTSLTQSLAHTHTVGSNG